MEQEIRGLGAIGDGAPACNIKYSVQRRTYWVSEIWVKILGMCGNQSRKHLEKRTFRTEEKAEESFKLGIWKT